MFKFGIPRLPNGANASLVSQNRAVASAFVLTRATMAAVILGTLFLGGFEQQSSSFFLVQGVVASAAVVALVMSVLALIRLFRKQHPNAVHPGFLIALDAVLAIGVMAVIDTDTSPLAWVALITPVLETAVFFSVSTAAFVWFGLSLAFLALRLTTNVTDDATTDTLVLSIQQVLAVLFVSGPAALMADSAQDRIQRLGEARRDADRTSTQLRKITESAREMSGQPDIDGILNVTSKSAAAIGFDQADVLVRSDLGRLELHSTHANGPALNLPPEVLSEALEDSVASIDQRDPGRGESLKMVGINSGHALALGDSGGQDSPADVVLRVWTKDGTASTEDIQALALLGGHAREALRAAHLLQEAQSHRDQLLYEVRHDSLTGLANRSFVLESLSSKVADKHPLALLFIDLDGFKGINDTLGHIAGDDALVTVADRLQKSGRDDALVGRMGGDEFVVMVPLTKFETIETLQEFGDSIVKSVSEPMIAAGQPAQLGASVGIAVHDGTMDADQLISLADDAMYDAKRDGGGTKFSQASLQRYSQRSA